MASRSLYRTSLPLHSANVRVYSTAKPFTFTSTPKRRTFQPSRATTSCAITIMTSSFLAYLYSLRNKDQNVVIGHGTSSGSPSEPSTSAATMASGSAQQPYASWSVLLKADTEESERLEVERKINQIIRTASQGQLSATTGDFAPISRRNVNPRYQLLWLRIPRVGEMETAAKIGRVASVEKIEKSPPVGFALMRDDAVASFSMPNPTWHRSLVYGRERLPKCTTDDTKTLMFVVDSAIDASHPEFKPKQVSVLESGTGNTMAQNVTSESWLRRLHPIFPTTSAVTEFNASHKLDNAKYEHGTFVASLIAGRHIGIAPGHEIISVPLKGEWGYEQVELALVDIRTFLEARRKAGKSTRAIINLSLGGRATTQLDYVIDDLLDYSVTIVGASGNRQANKPFPDPAGHRFPGCHDSVLVVGAVDHHLREADFSNFGHRVDVLAPGQGICGAKSGTDGYLISDGTSYAAPIVCGVALQFLARNPHHLHRSLKDIVKGLGYSNGRTAALYWDTDNVLEQQARDKAIVPPLIKHKGAKGYF